MFAWTLTVFLLSILIEFAVSALLKRWQDPEGMAKEVEQVIRGAHGIHGAALDLKRHRPLPHVFKKAVHVAVGIALRRKKGLVQLEVKGAAGLAIGHFVAIPVRFRCHAKFRQHAVATFKLPRGDQHILVAGGPVIRLGIQAAAYNAFDNEGIYPGGSAHPYAP